MVSVFDAAYTPDAVGLVKIKNVGGVGVMGYVAGGGTRQWKRLTPADATLVIGQSLDLGYNYEGSAAEALVAGYKGGMAAAAIACADAYAAFARGGETIYFSVDTNTPTNSYAAVADYFTGVNVVCAGHFKVGFYGQGDLARKLIANGRVQPGYWLAAPKSWPGYNPTDPFVGMHQLVGSAVAGTDQNTVMNRAALGLRAAVLEDDMPTLDEIAAAVWNYGLTQGSLGAPAYSWITGDRFTDGDTFNGVSQLVGNMRNEYPFRTFTYSGDDQALTDGTTLKKGSVYLAAPGLWAHINGDAGALTPYAALIAHGVVPPAAEDVPDYGTWQNIAWAYTQPVNTETDVNVNLAQQVLEGLQITNSTTSTIGRHSA